MKDKELELLIQVKPGKLVANGQLWSVLYQGREIVPGSKYPYVAAARWFEANVGGVWYMKDQHGTIVRSEKIRGWKLVESSETGLRWVKDDTSRFIR